MKIDIPHTDEDIRRWRKNNRSLLERIVKAKQELDAPDATEWAGGLERWIEQKDE